jgi:hypothetical protein
VQKRGRKSAAELSIVVPVEFDRKPEPPEELTPTQAEIWRKTVASENPDFFKTAATRGLLVDYCRHRDAAEGVASIIDSFQPEWLKSAEGCKRYESLLRIRSMETRGAVSMARALRLTNQSRYVPETAATAGRNKTGSIMPWDDA